MKTESDKNATTVKMASDREVVVTRTFDSPARLVFEAWTRAELFEQWWVPRSLGATLRSCELDARTGGTYRLAFGDEAEETMVFYGRYLEVVPNSRIVWTNDENGESSSITTVTLEERDGKTHLVLSELYPSKEAFDAAGTGAPDALRETFEQLDEVLTGLSR